VRILEVKGVSSNEKNALIQDALSVLIQKKPHVFDYEIFSTMQQFMLLAREEFVHDRECFHLVRIIYAIYLFKKKLEFLSDQQSNVRHILLKVSSLRIHLPFETKKVLGVFVGINFLHKNEVFDESHVLKSIKNYIPDADLLENSTIIFPSPDEKIQVIYVEIQKKSGCFFSQEEIFVLRQKLSPDLKHHVEKLMPAVFMPRNEEEVMKNILVLSHELKYFRDLPQVIISFDEQAENELVFTIIYLRLLLERDAVSIENSYKKNNGRFVFEIDRVKNVGMLRGKYPKEASVFRLRLPKHVFLREDLTLDLLKARQEVVYELHHVLGEFRDYNGGMIARQTEVLTQLKMEMFHLDKNQELLFENLFHSLVPMEARTVVPLETIKNLFYCWQESVQKDGLACTFYEYQTYTCLVTKSKEPFNKEMVASVVKGLGVSSCQLITALIQHEDVFYLCSLLISEEKTVRGQWQKIAADMSEALCGSFV
jgi:hypothetical protein